MGFLRFFSFEHADFKITTERLGIAIFCAILTVGSTFAPVINTPHISLTDYPSDLSDSRGFLLLVEVLSIGFNMISLRNWAGAWLGVTLFTLIVDLYRSFEIIDAINAYLGQDPSLHYTQHAGLAWGWWLIILGPAIMTLVWVLDYIRD